MLSSPLLRATETASLAGLDAEPDPRLTEWDYGDYEGRTTPEIRDEVPRWTIWTGPIPGGETAAEVGARVDGVLDRVRAVEGDVAIVAHGHLLRVLAVRWIGLTVPAGAMLALDTGTVSELGWEREVPVIHRWNGAP